MKYAFIFGSNYKGTSNELSGCIKDCQKISNYLQKFSYKITNAYSENVLNWQITKNKFISFLQGLSPGDIGVIFYAGHGIQLPDNNGDEIDGKDEVLYISSSVKIRDDELAEIIQKNVKKDVNLVCFFDCCCSGSILDLPNRLENLKIIKENNKKFDANIACISGCRDNQASGESLAGGNMTNSLMISLVLNNTIDKERPMVDLFLKLCVNIYSMSMCTQNPVLSFSNQDALKIRI